MCSKKTKTKPYTTLRNMATIATFQHTAAVYLATTSFPKLNKSLSVSSGSPHRLIKLGKHYMTASASRWSSVTGKHITLTGPMKMPLQEINNGRQAGPTSSLDMLLNAA